MRLEVLTDPARSWPLRQAVLRPDDTVDHRPSLPGATEIGAVDDDGTLLGVGLVAPEGHPRDPRPGDWRLRGMATSEAARGTGAGGLVLTALLRHVRTCAGTRLWCNARIVACGFYEHHGLVVEGEVFEVEGIGPHLVMTIAL